MSKVAQRLLGQEKMSMENGREDVSFKDVYQRLLYEVRFGSPSLRDIEVWQDRPYTAVRLDATTLIDTVPFLARFWREQHYSTKRFPNTVATGWSKANWPDKWDEGTGYKICLERACKKIAKELYYGS